MWAKRYCLAQEALQSCNVPRGRLSWEWGLLACPTHALLQGVHTNPFTDWVLLPLPALHLEGYYKHQYFCVCSLWTSMQNPRCSSPSTTCSTSLSVHLSTKWSLNLKERNSGSFWTCGILQSTRLPLGFWIVAWKARFSPQHWGPPSTLLLGMQSGTERGWFLWLV